MKCDEPMKRGKKKIRAAQRSAILGALFTL
jgi:hypothetical protein